MAVYLPTASHEFVFDDDIAIVRNTWIRSLTNLPEIFSTTEWSGGGLQNYLYRPLTTYTYALNYRLSGLEPWSYHVVNVLLHGVVALLVFGLGLRWRLPIAAAGLGGLIFALHPVHVEAVASVVGRRDILASAFLLAMVLTHSRAVVGNGRRPWPVLAYGAAMFSKEMGTVGIGLVLLHDWLLPEDGVDRPLRQRRLRSLYASYAATLLAYLLIRRAVVGGFGIATIPYIDNPLAHASPIERWLTAIAVIGKGLVLQLLPTSLSPDYSYNAIPLVTSPLEPRFALTALVLVTAAGVAVARRRRNPLILIALGLYMLSLLPAANLLFPSGTVFGERLLYLPGVAVALVAGLALNAVTRRVSPRVRILITVAILLPLVVATTLYARVWHDDLSLFTAAARSVPSSTKAHSNLASALLDAQQLDEAIAEGRRAVEIAPDNFRALALIGEGYKKLERYDEAEQWLRRALDVEPGYADALYILGQVRRDQGDLAEAGRLWSRALDSAPNHAGALSDLGTLALVNGNVERARFYSEQAVQANPLQANAWYNLGLIHERAGDLTRSREAFREFVRTAGPEYAQEQAAIRARLRDGLPDARTPFRR